MKIIKDSYNSKIRKQKHVVISFILTLLFPGLGQIYNGQFKKGLLFFIISILMPFVFGWPHLGAFLMVYIPVVLFIICFRIYILNDAVKYARKNKSRFPKKFNTWYYHSLLAIVIGFFTIQVDYHNMLGVWKIVLPKPSRNTIRTLKVSNVSEFKEAVKDKNNTGSRIITLDGFSDEEIEEVRKSYLIPLRSKSKTDINQQKE